jgi:hypothetical protein
MRTTSSPHCSRASHPTGHIFAEGHEALNEITNPCQGPSQPGPAGPGRSALKQHVQTDLEADRQVANTLAQLIIGGSLASTEIADEADGTSGSAA